MGLNTTPRTWVVAENVTAAELNTEVRDAFTGIQAASATYTPTWTTSGTGAVLGNGTILGKYFQIGKMIDFWVLLTPGTTTTFGTGVYSFGLPTSLPAASDGFIGIVNAQLLIGGVRWHGQSVISAGATTCQPFLSTSSTDPRLTQMGPTAPGTFASGNTLRLQGRYETA